MCKLFFFKKKRNFVTQELFHIFHHLSCNLRSSVALKQRLKLRGLGPSGGPSTCYHSVLSVMTQTSKILCFYDFSFYLAYIDINVHIKVKKSIDIIRIIIICVE